MIIPIFLLGGTGLVCGALLAVAARKFAVRKDLQVERINALLPGANCGACGYPGCIEYAKAILHDNAPISRCMRGGQATLDKITAYLGAAAHNAERQVAIVLCQGDRSRTKRRALYNGVADCQAVELVAGSAKSCPYGCLGLGSCVRACPVHAIELTKQYIAFVRPELCIGCGKCVAVCPRRLIKLVPVSRSIHVLCVSKDKGSTVRAYCAVGCIGCGICAKTLNNRGVTMEGALAVVDYTVVVDNVEVVAKCSRKTMVVRPGIKL